MKSITHLFARRLALTLLAMMMTFSSWAQLQGEGTEAKPYLINDADDWMTFTNMINDGVGSSAYYSLKSDIELGTEKEPLTTIVGTDNKPFCGVFMGNHHTLLIYMSRTTKYAAPFGVTNGAVISDLKVEGTITTTNKFAAGIIAYSNNKNNKVTTLNRCISSVHIICDNIQTVQAEKPYDCTHGGLVGQNEAGTLNFNNCLFDGWIKDFTEEKKANKCTGFVGWVNNTVNYTDCIMAGVIDVKPNDDELANSMANYHRLALKNAKANFYGTNYTIFDYTYHTMPMQGVLVDTVAPENCISRIYSYDKTQYYIPSATINNYDVTFNGWELKEGTDYTITLVESAESKVIFEGIKNFGGIYMVDVDPVFQMSIITWNATEKTGWYAISSPVEGQAFSATTHLTSPTVKHNIYRYNEEKRLWEEYRNEANIYTKFENGRGYLYRTEYNGGNIGYNGTLNSGDIKIKLSYTEKSTDNLSGMNLIGNPYPHEIYKSVAISEKNLVAGYNILTQEGTWEFKSNDFAIPEGMAVLVQALSEPSSKGDYTLTMIDTDAAPDMKDSSDEIWFTVKNSEYKDVAHVMFNDGEGFGKMPHYNAEAPMLYVQDNGKNYASAHMSGDVESINLCFESKAMSQYTLRFNAKGNYSYLHLIDKLTGADVNMLTDDEYTFVSSINDDAERFIVKLSDNETMTSNNIFAWQNGSDVMVDGNGKLQVFDVTGRMVLDVNVNGIEVVSVPAQGVYVLRLMSDTVKTQKIVVR